MLDGFPKSALNLSYNAYNSHLATIADVCGLFSSTCYKFSRQQRLQMSHVCASVTLFAQCCFKQIWPQVFFNSKVEVYKSWRDLETARLKFIILGGPFQKQCWSLQVLGGNSWSRSCIFWLPLIWQTWLFQIAPLCFNVFTSHYALSLLKVIIPVHVHCSLNTILGTIEQEASGPHFLLQMHLLSQVYLDVILYWLLKACLSCL